MANAESAYCAQDSTGIPLQPKKPNPSSDPAVVPDISSLSLTADGDTPPSDHDIDPSTLTPVGALKILGRGILALVELTGDVPPTPPISRPTTPSLKELRVGASPSLNAAASSSNTRPLTPSSSNVPHDDLQGPYFRNIPIGSPEAHASEPGGLTYASEPLRIQHEAIARKFFSKKPPPISIEDYLQRMHRYCPMSTAVYLAATTYIYRLAVEDRSVPVTLRTAHRLMLAALRVAMKALEDLSYPHQRFAGVGGVSERELAKLEVALCFLLDFELQVTNDLLSTKVRAIQTLAACGRPPPRLKLPPKMNVRRLVSAQPV